MTRRRKPVLGVDYVIDSAGHAQFTRDYLLQRGSCCEHDCRFCPFPCEIRTDAIRSAQFARQELVTCQLSVKLAG
jgi:hypothetical protein